MTVPIRFVSDYNITSNTYLLESKKDGKKIHTIVYEKSGAIEVSKRPLRLIHIACENMGSNYRASINRSKQFLNENKHKFPLVVATDYGHPQIMFPLMSPKSHNNIWLSFNAITNIVNNKTHVTVTFKDSLEVDLFIHISSLNNQYVTSAMLYKAVLKHWNRFMPI